MRLVIDSNANGRFADPFKQLNLTLNTTQSWP